jgi:hypothetical protein
MHPSSSFTFHPTWKTKSHGWLTKWHAHIFGLTYYVDERSRSHKHLCAINCYVNFNSHEVTQTFLCWYHQLLHDLQFSFMWGHTNLFMPITSIVMWPLILIHVRSHNFLCPSSQLLCDLQILSRSNFTKAYSRVSKPIGNLTQIVLLTNYLHSQDKGLRMKW